MSHKIDELDISILRELRGNARQSYREIADKLKVAEGTVYNRVNRLKEDGVITGFMVNIDWGKLGYDIVAVIGVAVEGGRLPEVEKALAADPRVTTVYDVTGEYDAMLVGKFKDRASLDHFIKNTLSMKFVSRTYTMMVLNVVKDSHGVEL